MRVKDLKAVLGNEHPSAIIEIDIGDGKLLELTKDNLKFRVEYVKFPKLKYPGIY